uniref:Uncharacterized protein n=1 Tax=Anopheles culicifacies TaxID=139723 RepID=A0A182M9E2_9DIPT
MMYDGEGQQMLLPSKAPATTLLGEEGDDGTIVSLSPDGADSGIGVDLDVRGRSIEGTPGVSDNEEDSFSCDCVCSCCCKCREAVGISSIPSPVITFLSQQYTRLPSLQPPTPPIANQASMESSVDRFSSISTKSAPRSRSTTRLDDVVMAAVKRHDDNTMAAIVRRRRRLTMRAKSGEYQSVPLVIPEPSDHNLDRATSSAKAVTSNVTSSAATLMPPTPTNGVRTLEIKFVW